MIDNALQYTIEVDDTPAQEGTARVNKAFDSVTDKATRAASQSETAFSSMTSSIIAGAGLITSAFSAGGAAVGSFASYVFRAGEGALALSAAAGLVTAEMVKWTAANATAGNAMELLVNSWRAFELIATDFAWYAVAGVGVGLLAEETFKLVNARGKLIEQEAYFAASNKIGIGEVERSDTIAQLSGIPRADVRGALSSLKDQFSSNGAEVRSNLKEIGVPDYLASGGATTELLAEIAKRFDAIPDPVARANAAIVFFGKETAGKVLPELNGHFADAAKAADDWALGLSDKTRNQVFAFRQTLQELKTELMGFGVTFHAVTAAAEQAFVVAGAKVFDFVQSIRHAIGEFAPEPKTLLDLRTPPSLAEAERDTGFLLNKRLNEGPARAGDMATAVALRDEARAELARESNGKDALEAQLSRARGLKSEAEKKLDATARGSLPMSVPDTIAVSSAYVTTSREVTSLENQLDQLKNATETENKTFEARKASRELVYRSFASPDTGRDIRGEIEKMTTFTTTDREGRVHEERLRLDDETRRNLETAFRVFTLDLAKKNATAELKIEEEKIQKREQYEEKLFEKRLEYSTRIAEMEVATDDRTLSHQRELLTYSRDEHLGALAGTRPQTVQGKLALEQRKLGIESDYITQNSVQESEGLDRQKSRELQDLAGKRYLNEIDDQTYFSGRAAITRKYGEQGGELNDKFSHELITAQQNAANASTEIVRSAQEKEFSSLKTSVEGVLNAMETKSQSVFSAIGNSLKAALLGAFNEIVSSQIAKALFEVLNPGAHVSFDSSRSGGKMGGFLGALGMGAQPVFSGGTDNHTATLKVSTDTNTSATAQNTSAIDRLTSALSGGHSASTPSGSSGSLGPASAFRALSPVGSLASGALSGLIPLAASGMAMSFPSGAGMASAGSAVSEAISFDGGGTVDLGGTATAGLGGPSLGAETLGIPSGMSLPGFGGLSGLGIPGIGGSSGGGGGLLGGILGHGGTSTSGGGGLGGILGGGGLKGLGSSLNQFIGGAFHPGNTVGLAGNLSQLGHSSAALMGGGLLVADGLKRGGFTGTLEDTAGGALMGFKVGGPIGAAIGAGIGLGVGLLREFVFGGDRQHAKDLVKQVYGMSISDKMADSIVKIAKEDYGGEVDVAVRSQKVRDMLMLYAEGTGQKLPLSSMKPESASLAEVGGKAYQQTSLIDGQNYAYQSSMPVLGGYTPTIYPTAQNSQAVHLNVNLDRQATTDVFEGKITQTVNPGYVQGQYSSALNSSAGRLNNAAALAQPGLIIS